MEKTSIYILLYVRTNQEVYSKIFKSSKQFVLLN